MSDKPNAPLVLFIQVVGLTAAAVFGVFSALAWSQAVKAGYEAAAANTIAIFTLCNSQNRTDTDPLGTLCMSVTNAAQQSLSAVASSLFPSRTSAAPTATASGTPLELQKPFIFDSVPTIVTIVLGTLAGISSIVCFLTFLAHKKKSSNRSPNYPSYPSYPNGY